MNERREKRNILIIIVLIIVVLIISFLGIWKLVNRNNQTEMSEIE